MYYKELEVWKKSIELVKGIYEICNEFPQSEQFGLTAQLKRAVISVPSNIAEGAARYSNKDTARFIDTALGSIAEVDTQLIIAKELGYANNIDAIQILLNQVNALLLGFKKHLNKTQE